jgi:hypothetical protein
LVDHAVCAEMKQECNSECVHRTIYIHQEYGTDLYVSFGFRKHCAVDLRVELSIKNPWQLSPEYTHGTVIIYNAIHHSAAPKPFGYRPSLRCCRDQRFDPLFHPT